MSPVYAKDVSNYSVELTDALLQQWQAEGTGLLLIQAFPPGYFQYAEQQRQIAACERNNLPYDCYIYDYLSDPTWCWGALDGIEGNNPRTVWLDEEDTETDTGMDQAYRAYIIRSRVWTVSDRGYRVGIYTGQWWWGPRVGVDPELATRPLWVAQYDDDADTNVFTPFGGWTFCAIKQYAGTQPDGTDLNVLSDDEAAELGGDMANCDTYKGAIETAVNRLQIELAKRTQAGRLAPLNRKLVAEIQSELFQALQT